MLLCNTTSINELICEQLSSESISANIWWINTAVNISPVLSMSNYILLPRRREHISDWSRDGEGGSSLGSLDPTRQLNTPWAWWICNWKLITLEVCWNVVLVINQRDRAWQIRTVTPLQELGVDGTGNLGINPIQSNYRACFADIDTDTFSLKCCDHRNFGTFGKK